MLHLDQNHSSLSKSNLILSNSPRQDQHSLLSWSPPARDDRPFYHTQHDQPQSDTTGQPNPDLPDASDSNQQASSSSLGPSSPAHAEDIKPSDPPASTSPTDATSPTSSLTPPPDTVSPAFTSTELPEAEPQAAVAVESTESGTEVAVENSAEVEKASRASTPLSELSSAPDAEDPPDGEKDTGDSASSAVAASKDADRARSSSARKADNLSNAVEEGKTVTNGHSESPHAQPTPITGTSTTKSESSSGSRAPSLGIATPEPSQASATSSQRLDPKVITILELNAELLKACMEFQTRSIPMSDPRAQQFAVRLQNNLEWLAAAADAKPNHNARALPQMQPPAPVDFLSMDRIQALYVEMPVIFAKDLRRRSMSAAGPGTQGVNGILKRERHDDLIGDNSASKRQHLGESKGSTPAPSTPQGRSSPAPSLMLPPATPPSSMAPPSLPGPSGSSPSMPPPSMPMGPHPNINEAQIAARERARQAHLRQAAMASQQSISGDGMRQMSPGSQQGMSLNAAGPSNMSHNPQAQMAALNSMGPMAMQVMQALQTPGHQVTQYLSQNIPGFQTMPLQQQMQHFMRVQQVMQARRQQAAQAAQANSISMGGIQQTSGPQSTLGGNMTGRATGLSNGSPTQISPTGQQFPMVHTGGSGLNPSNPMSGLTPAQQANLHNLTSHQKQQLLMMQQQQMMRGGNANPNILNSHQLLGTMQQQQRMMQQASSPSQMGSPMLGGSTDGTNYPPSLRSNPTVPGIARSSRTPSDHTQSPMTPQSAQMGGQRGMNQLSQGGMGQMGGNMNQSWSGNQQNSQMGQSQSYGISRPDSAGGFGIPGNGALALNNQQWNQSGQMMFPGGMGNQQLSDGSSRQTSSTPGPQQQLQQNSPMGNGTGLNEFDIFNWSQ
ncbi:hypothetical protein BC835DRAFT_1412405 [Cytidiella melzeri]|nr:hypothetical protein BC835DRAFT_1412405 [Cytidiella melzeri]